MKLIALDLDGTTLNSKKEISSETLKAIQTAQVQGHIVMALSGRSVKSIQSTLEKYNLDCPIGGGNGTVLYANGELVGFTSLMQNQANSIVSVLQHEDVPYNFSTNHGVYAPRDWDEKLATVLVSGRVPAEHYDNQYFTMFTTSPHVHGHSIFDRVDDILNDSDFTIQKFLLVTLDPIQKERIHKKLREIEGIFITSSSPFNLEITHVDGHKGTGLKQMAHHYKVPLENTVAIGDEHNDVPMFQAAGLAIAMANADDDVKKHADIVTLSNDENGVAYAFQKYIL